MVFYGGGGGALRTIHFKNHLGPRFGIMGLGICEHIGRWKHVVIFGFGVSGSRKIQ